MPDLKIALIYFSATKVTHTYAQVIQERLLDQGCVVQLFNVTAYNSRQVPLPLNDFDGFIFGFPVFADLAPSVINTWLPTLEGKGKKCALFFTYGARSTGYAHFHTMQLLEQAGFRVLLSAEFPGRHTFNIAGWKILPNRPDNEDFAVARDYADLLCSRFTRDASVPFLLQKPSGYQNKMEALAAQPRKTERGWTNPLRTTEECSLCRLCETECPARAFDAATGLSDPGRCIQCMHCVYICPDRVLAIDKRMEAAYTHFLADWHLTEPMMQQKKSRIITSFLDTAS